MRGKDLMHSRGSWSTLTKNLVHIIEFYKLKTIPKNRTGNLSILTRFWSASPESSQGVDLSDIVSKVDGKLVTMSR